MRILFMGTAEFAVPSLEAIINSLHKVIAVISQPDHPFGRGLKLRASPVKMAALKHNLSVITPDTLKEPTIIEEIRVYNPDAIVVVAYGKILPPTLLGIPKFGCINVHGSLLPKYRGAAPIQWALINGETETGITTMYMNDKMDEGDIIFQEKIQIAPEDNYGTLSKTLAQLGSCLILKTLVTVEAGTAPRISQNHQKATYAPKINNSDGQIDWNQPAEKIVNLVRGVTPGPGAYTQINGKRIKIISMKIDLDNSGCDLGRVILVGKHDAAGILVQTANHTTVRLLQVQPESGKIMSAAQFARGYQLTEGIHLGI